MACAASHAVCCCFVAVMASLRMASGSCCELCRFCVATVTTDCGNVLDGEWHVP